MTGPERQRLKTIAAELDLRRVPMPNGFLGKTWTEVLGVNHEFDQPSISGEEVFSHSGAARLTPPATRLLVEASRMIAWN